MSEDPSQINNRSDSALVVYVGILLQSIFVTGALLLFKERTLYADTAHFAAEITGGPGFFLGHRFIAFFSRILPFLSASAGSGIKTSLVLYSLNLALIYAIPFLLMVFVLKDRTMAFCLLLLQFLFTYRTYYIPISELQHGLVLLLLYWAYIGYLVRLGKPASRSLFTYALLAIIVNSHPLIMIAFVGSAVLFSEHRKYWRPADQKILVASGFLFYILSTVIFSTRYEAVILSNALGETFTHLDKYQIRLMIHTILRDYLPTLIVGIPAMALVISRYPVRKSLFLFFCLLLTGSLVYLRFAHITFTLTFFEVYLLPVPFILFLGAALSWNTIHRNIRNAGMVLIGILMVFQWTRVVRHADFYRERLELYTSVMNQMQEGQHSKVILPFYRTPMNKIVDFYASPFETYLLSHLDNDPGNDGFMITWLLCDTVEIRQYRPYADQIITLGIDSIALYPIARYPAFHLEPSDFSTFDPEY